jgi:hypothetical protein
MSSLTSQLALSFPQVPYELLMRILIAVVFFPITNTRFLHSLIDWLAGRVITTCLT